MIEPESYSLTTNGFKEDDWVCFCFHFTKKDIEKDYVEHGRSLIYEKIAFEKKAGACNCGTENPKGR